MPQVVRTTNDLIINSLYLIGELGVGESPDSFMLSTGIELINEVIDGFTADSIYIPFLTEIDFLFVPGKQTYSISDILVGTDIVADRLANLVFANYTVEPTGSEPIVYPLRIISKAEYYNVVHLLNLQTRPGFIFLNKQATESFITVYPAPDQPYPCQLQAKVFINGFDAGDDLSGLPPYYYGFLKFALGRRFKAYYPSANWPQENEDIYLDYFNNLKNANELDLTLTPSVVLTSPEPFYWPNILAY